MPDSKGFKYAYSVGQIDEVLEKIKNTGRPDKLTASYLKDSWILKNAQYGAVLEILKAMKFLGSDGAPTELYAEFTNKKFSQKALSTGVRNAYPSLFKAYPKANTMSKDDLEGYIKQQTGADTSVVAKIYGTIKRLMSLADFSSSEDGSESLDLKKHDLGIHHSHSAGSKTIPITMNIQIVLPNDATPETYDSIFTSIKNNLLG